MSIATKALGLLGMTARTAPNATMGFPSTTLPLISTTPFDRMVAAEPIPFHKRGRTSGWSDPLNLSQTLDISKMNAAIRMAERGDPWQLFTLFRDMTLSSTHLQSVWGVRKMAITAEPFSILPFDKSNQDDVRAVDVIKQMIDGCAAWSDGLNHLLDATLWPLAICEKIYEPASGEERVPIRYKLKKLEPVNPQLMTYKLAYMARGAINQGGTGLAASLAPAYGSPALPFGNNPDLVYNPDDWEPDVRLYRVFDNGYVDRSIGTVYRLTRDRHLVHRGGTLSTAIRDNYGGAMRGTMMWLFFCAMGRDLFARFMEHFGMPLAIVLADMQQEDTVKFLTESFQQVWNRWALFLDQNTVKSGENVKFEQVNTANSAEAWQLWLEFCKSEVTHLVLGQETSHTAKPTGLGSGVAKQQEKVRQDIRAYDALRLGTETLRQQLFEPFLRLNGYSGQAPRIVWGGADQGDAKSESETLLNMSNAGLEPADDQAMDIISERVGYRIQKKPVPEADADAGAGAGKPPVNKGDEDGEGSEDTKTFAVQENVDPTLFCEICDCADCSEPEDNCPHWCHTNEYALANSEARAPMRNAVRSATTTAAILEGKGLEVASEEAQVAVREAVAEARAEQAAAEKAADAARKAARMAGKSRPEQDAVGAAARTAHVAATKRGASQSERKAMVRLAKAQAQAAGAAAALILMRRKKEQEDQQAKADEDDEDEQDRQEAFTASIAQAVAGVRPARITVEAPIINIPAYPDPAPITLNVELKPGKRKQKVLRDKQGRVSGTEEVLE